MSAAHPSRYTMSGPCLDSSPPPSGQLLGDLAPPVETLFEIVALLLSPLPKGAWLTRAE